MIMILYKYTTFLYPLNTILLFFLVKQILMKKTLWNMI